MRKAIEDNDPSDDDISLEDCVVHALTNGGLGSTGLPFGNLRKSNRVLLGCICLEFMLVL